MYAVVKTGGKQYKVAPGDVISVEKLQAEVGDEVELPVICVFDGETIEADPIKAAATKVVAEILEQYKDKKQIVFKFKKRKGYKKLNGHRQQLTKVRILSVGSDKFKKAEKKVDAKAVKEKVEKVKEDVEEAVEDVAGSLEDMADDLKAAVEEKKAAKKAAVKEKAEAAKEALEEKADAIEDKAEAVKEALEDKAEAIKDAVEEAVESAKDAE